MALATLGGRLLVQAGRLAESLACCCVRWCRQTGQDACGNTTYACSTQQEGSLGPCTPECSQPPEPCECGPNVPCPPCYECVDRKCVRTENCCADGAQCPPCATCVNGTCVGCGECQQCIYGVCSPCGECQKCDGGDCVPCDSGEVCIGGVCVPKQYYCCWDSCADKAANNNNTTCKPAVASSGSQTDPCGEDNTSGGCGSLRKSGPFGSLSLCQPNCQKYKCVPDACGNRECVPDPTGPYGSLSACQAGCPQDPCSSPCSFSGASGPGFYSIDACRRELCINFVSLESRPMRVAIFAPQLDANCNVVASSVEQVDSGWRGEECCDCAARQALGGTLAGDATASLRWTKPRGVQSFEVRVYLPCGGEYEMDIQCNPNPPLPGGGFAGDAECAEMPDPQPCPCENDGDCNEGCHCCNGACQSEPCDGCETAHDCIFWAVTYQCDSDDYHTKFFATLQEANDFYNLFPGGGGPIALPPEYCGSPVPPCYCGYQLDAPAQVTGLCCNGQCCPPDAHCCDGACQEHPCPCACPEGCDSGCLVVPSGVNPASFKEIICNGQSPVDVDYPCAPGADCVGHFCCCNPLP